MQNLKLIDYTKKRLDDMYVMMYTIKNDLNIKKGDIIETIDIYTLIGINKKGIRQLVVNVNMKCHKNVIIKMS